MTESDVIQIVKKLNGGYYEKEYYGFDAVHSNGFRYGSRMWIQ
jgi:hypothetical protein